MGKQKTEGYKLNFPKLPTCLSCKSLFDSRDPVEINVKPRIAKKVP